MARIVSLTARFPYPPYRGDTRRALHLITHLASAHDHHLVSFVEQEDESMRHRMAQMAEMVSSVHTAVLPRWRSLANLAVQGCRRLPGQAIYYSSRRMRALVRRRVRELKPDLLLVHLFRMAPYAMGLGVPVLVDLTDVISFELQQSLAYLKPPKRWAYWMEANRIEAYENMLARRAEAVMLCSRRDAGILQARVPELEPFVVPNVVDTGVFSHDGVVYDPNLIVFCGRLDCRHNEEAVLRFAHKIMPLVQRKRKQARFHLIGMSPSRRVRALISSGRATHESPEAMDEYVRAVRKGAVSVAPLAFAAGTQCKVLESMAAGVPVVTTTVSNDGLRGTPGEHLMVENEDTQFAECVAEVLGDAKLRDSLSVNGRHFVEKTFGMAAMAGPLDAAVTYAVERGKGRASGR